MSSNAITNTIPKPPVNLLRKPLQNYLKRHLVIGTVVGIAAALLYKFTVFDVRKRNYKHFYTTWDDDRHYKRMVQAGVFQFVKPDQELPEWVKNYEAEVDEAIAALKK